MSFHEAVLSLPICLTYQCLENLHFCEDFFFSFPKININCCRSWDHHDILSVLPEYNSTSHCSTSARLRSVAPYSGRKETAVYATDVNTGVVIRCKVFIDKLSRIQIFHNSVKLDLDGLATLRVRAFDNEGIFSHADHHNMFGPFKLSIQVVGNALNC